MPTMTIREQFEEDVKTLTALADAIDRDTKDGKPATPGQLAEIDALSEKVANGHAAVIAEGRVSGKRKEAQAFLAEITGQPVSKTTERPTHTAAGLPMNPGNKTLGQLFTESGEYSEFRKRYAGRDGNIPDSVKGIQSPTFMTDMKALVTGASDTSGGAFVRNDIYAPVTDLVGERELSVADLVTRGTTDSDTIEYVRITGKTNNAAPVPEATQAGLPATYNAPTAGELTSGGYKPESGLALEKVTTTVKTLAHWMPITKRAASDAGQVRTLVDNFLRYGLQEELEDQMLTGAGTGENFQGILGSGISTVGSAGTDIDAIVDAIRTIRVTGRRRPTAVVMHPNDWYSTGFLLSKDTTGRYLVGDPRASLEQLNTLWGMRVVVTEAMTENTALVGDFRYAVLWEREGITLSVSDSHLDFFTRNLLAILAEMRAGFGVLDVQAFCSVTAV